MGDKAIRISLNDSRLVLSYKKPNKKIIKYCTDYKILLLEILMK